MPDEPAIKLGNIATFEMGQSPPSSVVVEGDRGVPFLQGCADFGQQYPQPHCSCLRPPKSCKKGDVLMSVRAPVGTINKADREYCIGRGLAAVRLSEEYPENYGWHLLGYWAPGLRRVAQGTTFEAVGRDDLADLDVVDIQPENRFGVASTLDAVDEAIAKTEALIAKLKAVKQGLLHDLLTRGLDDNGELRRQSHGLPERWEQNELSQYVPTAEYGISSALHISGEVPVLRMQNIADGTVDLSDMKYAGRAAVSGRLLCEGDVLFNRTNSMEHVGRTGIWRGELEVASFASYLVRLVPDRSRLLPEHLNLWLNWGETQRRIRKWATTGVQQVNINPTNLRKEWICLPKDTAEQQRIVDSLAAFEGRIRTEEYYCDKLKAIKRGLMQDLLTGRVRVNVKARAKEK